MHEYHKQYAHKPQLPDERRDVVRCGGVLQLAERNRKGYPRAMVLPEPNEDKEYGPRA